MTSGCEPCREPKVKVPPGRPGHRRQRLPVEVIWQHWSLSAWRPCPAAVRPLTQSAFVDEDDGAALVFGLFLTPASASASTCESCLRPAPTHGQSGVGNSILVAAESARHARRGSECHILFQSGGRLAPTSTDRSPNLKLAAPAWGFRSLDEARRMLRTASFLI
jgi:hypothetical protein